MAKKFTIKRSQWYRGQGGEESRLVRPQDGKKCCLGFYMQSCGVRVKDMADVLVPSSLARNKGIRKKQTDWLFKGKDSTMSSASCSSLVHINDGDGPVEIESEEERESKITQIFAKHGITVEFVD